MTLLQRFDELERVLWREVEPLYAACHATEGGYIEHASETWIPAGDARRTLVFQSRMLWTAARIAIDRPARRSEWISHIEHGVEMLERFWDPTHGGFRWAIDTHGRSLESDAHKHAYGQAFGTFALATAAMAFPESGGLPLARRAADWLETRAFRDGWFIEACDEAGKPFEPPAGQHDAIGTPPGAVSMNTTIHLLEAYTALSQAGRDSDHRERLRWLFDFLIGRFVHEEGYGVPFLAPDGSATPFAVSYGHDLEAGHLLCAAAEALADRVALERARNAFQRLAHHAVRFGRHEGGGICESGPPLASGTDRTRIWWVQAESINALTHLHELNVPDPGIPWLAAATDIWDAARRELLDPGNGGWAWSSDPTINRLPGHTKVAPWKAAYHTARCLLATVDRMKKLSSRRLDSR